MTKTRALCDTCGDRPRMHASTLCRPCRQAQRQAYWKNRDDGRDYPEHIIEAKFWRAVWLKNPAKAQRLLQARRAA
jgi:hypothetical protein